MGYSQAELDEVQAKWRLRLPPDLIEFLRERRLLIDSPECFDWVTADPGTIRERLAWPFETYWRSVERHELWWPEWESDRPLQRIRRKNWPESSRVHPSLFRL